MNKTRPKPPAAGIGRKKGVPNKTTQALKEMILMALEKADKGGGIGYLTRQANENPTAFMALVGKVLPMTLQGNGTDGSFRVEVITGVPRNDRTD